MDNEERKRRNAEACKRYRERRDRDPVRRERALARQAEWRNAHPDYQRAWGVRNPELRASYSKSHEERNPGAMRERGRAYDRRNAQKRRHAFRAKRYGITPEEFVQRVTAQGGVCAVCEGIQSVPDRALCVDHNHKTGVVRDLLCDNCNKALGIMGDSSERLLAAARYLQKWGC